MSESTESTKLVRIKPSSPRRQHVIGGYTFWKERGWHEVPEAVAKLCQVEPLHDMNPEGPLVFDVKEPGEAKVIAEAEAKKEDPAGTPDRPIVPEARLPRGRATERTERDR